MKRSPVQLSNLSPEMKGIALQAKLTGRLVQIHEEFLDNMDEIREIIVEARSLAKEGRDQLSRIKSLPKGAKGDPGVGIPGRPGKNGKDADPVDIMEIAELAASLIPKPKEKEPEIEKPEDEEKEIEEIVQRVLNELDLDTKFKKIHNEMGTYRSQLAGKIYGTNTWARGGGGSSTSSGKSVTTQYLLTAVQAGSDVTIALTQLTNWATFDQLITLTRNNIPQTLGVDFTLAGSTVTIANADAGESFNATYSYA